MLIKAIITMTIIYSLVIVLLLWYIVHLVSTKKDYGLNDLPKAEKKYSKEVEKKEIQLPTLSKPDKMTIKKTYKP